MTGVQARAARRRAHMNQEEFWGRIGVSQEAGSRYERGLAPIPLPVRILLKLIYVEEDRDARTALALLRHGD